MPAQPLRLPSDSTQDIGWRIRQLRLRRRISLQALSARTGKHASQLSRVERPEARTGAPKPSTVSQLLDALGATPAERRAVFHEETPGLTHGEINKKVRETAVAYEKSRTASILIDEHWYRWYMNPAARAILALSPEEYAQTLGINGLAQLINPSSPLYSRYPDNTRKEMFSMWAAVFRFHFADQQFDRWYLDIDRQISKILWADQIWQSPPYEPEFVDCQVMTVLHPQEGILKLRVQLNQMLKTPRFAMVELTPLDDETAQKVAGILHEAGLDSE